MAKKKRCTHPRGYDRTGRCPLCGTAKPGRPAGSSSKTRTAQPVPAPAAPPPPAAVALPPLQPGADRASRIARAYPAPAPAAAEPVPEAIEPDEAEQEPEAQDSKETTSLGYGWDWTSRKLVTGLDIGTSILIEHFLGRDPLDAGEEETEELERLIAEYGEKRIGKVEAPLWLVFLIALVFFFLSKYAGAPKKEPPAKPAPKPEPVTPGKTTSAVADTAVTKIPAGAADAATTETPRPAPAPTAAVTGSVEGVTVGY